MTSILVFLGCLALGLNFHMLVDNIVEHRYIITPINIFGILCALATIFCGVGVQL